MITEEITKYHWDNLYGMESDPKIHEDYWKNYLNESTKQELLEEYKDLMNKIGSWNSSQTGKLNAVIQLLNEKYPDWRN